MSRERVLQDAAEAWRISLIQGSNRGLAWLSSLAGTDLTWSCILAEGARLLDRISPSIGVATKAETLAQAVASYSVIQAANDDCEFEVSDERFALVVRDIAQSFEQDLAHLAEAAVAREPEREPLLARTDQDVLDRLAEVAASQVESLATELFPGWDSEGSPGAEALGIQSEAPVLPIVPPAEPVAEDSIMEAAEVPNMLETRPRSGKLAHALRLTAQACDAWAEMLESSPRTADTRPIDPDHAVR